MMSFFDFFSTSVRYTAIFLAVAIWAAGGLFILWIIIIVIGLICEDGIEKHQPTPEDFNGLEKIGFIPPSDFILLYFASYTRDKDRYTWLFFSKKDFVFEYENFDFVYKYTFSNDTSYCKNCIININKMISYSRGGRGNELEIKDADFISSCAFYEKNYDYFYVDLTKTKKGNYCEITHRAMKVIQSKDNMTDEEFK